MKILISIIFILMGISTSFCQDTLDIEYAKSHAYFQSEYYYLSKDSSALDSSYYIVAAVNSDIEVAHKNFKQLQSIYPQSFIAYNEKNGRYYSIVYSSQNSTQTIETLKMIRSLYEPLAWVLVYF